MNRALLAICVVLLLSLAAVVAIPHLFVYAQPKVEQMGNRLDQLDNFIGELKSEREEKKAQEARIQAELAKKKMEEAKRLQAEADAMKAKEAEDAKIKAELEKQRQLEELETAKKIVAEARRIQAEAEQKKANEARIAAELAKKKEEEARQLREAAEKKRLDDQKRLQAEAEAKKFAEKRAADELIKTLQSDLIKIRKELENLKTPLEIVPTQPPKKPVGSRSFDGGGSYFVPTQPPPVPQPNPKTSSVRLENETDEIAKVKINDSTVDVEARKVKFVTVPAGQFTYQVLGVHEKPILSELNEGQVYGLAIRNAPKGVKQDTKQKEDALPKPPPPTPPDEKELPQKPVGGSVRLFNRNSVTVPFGVNGKTYRVEPGQEILVKVPVGRCVVGFPGLTSQTWGYDIVEGTTLRLGCNLGSAPVQGYYYSQPGFYPSCGFR